MSSNVRPHNGKDKSDVLEAFSREAGKRGINLPASSIIADGAIHRTDTFDKPGKSDASYTLHLDGVPAGGFENHADGDGWQKWKSKGDAVAKTDDDKKEIERRRRKARESSTRQSHCQRTSHT